MKVIAGSEPRRFLFHEDRSNVGGSSEPVSVVELIILPDLFGKRPAGYIHKVYTDEGFRNIGYASTLVKKAIEFAKEQGCYKVFLICSKDTVPFYEKNCQMKLNQVEMEVRL